VWQNPIRQRTRKVRKRMGNYSATKNLVNPGEKMSGGGATKKMNKIKGIGKEIISGLFIDSVFSERSGHSGTSNDG